MKNRTVVIGAVVGVLVVALWWMFVFSGIRDDATKTGEDIDTAQTENQALEAEKAQLEALEEQLPEIQARLGRLQQAIPVKPELATFIDTANAIGVESGVAWLSVSPSEPTAGSVSGTIGLTMQIQGGYYEVLDYLNRLEELARLVVVDSISASGATDEASAAPVLSVSVTGRMFTQSTSAAGEGAPVVTDDTAPEVEGGGGVAATGSES